MRISDWSSDVCSSDLIGASIRSIRMARDARWRVRLLREWHRAWLRRMRLEGRVNMCAPPCWPPRASAAGMVPWERLAMPDFFHEDFHDGPEIGRAHV